LFTTQTSNWIFKFYSPSHDTDLISNYISCSLRIRFWTYCLYYLHTQYTCWGRVNSCAMCWGKITISIRMGIDWVWKYMNLWTYLTYVAKTWTKVSPYYKRGNLWCFVRWQWLIILQDTTGYPFSNEGTPSFKFWWLIIWT